MAALVLLPVRCATTIQIVPMERMKETVTRVSIAHGLVIQIARFVAQSAILNLLPTFSPLDKDCDIPSVRCNDGTCVDYANVCDTTEDCPDGEDEDGCRKLVVLVAIDSR